MRNVGLEETPAGVKIARRNINNLRYADDTTLMAESEEELWTHACTEGGRKVMWGVAVCKTRGGAGSRSPPSPGNQLCC